MISESPISQRIDHIFSSYYKSRALEKSIGLLEDICDFYKLLDFPENFWLYLDDVKVISLVDSYFLDVIRYKEYHFNPDDPDLTDPFSIKWTESVHRKKRISPVKVAALTTKWILKYLPIQIGSESGVDCESKYDDLILEANSLFCLAHISCLLDLDLSKIDREIRKDLLYHFRFRNFDERHFFIVLGLLSNEQK